ncbi:PREDICTED: NAC transcription factor 29-like [Camelina sativa]|uniref:NAC transcription factor 29-like n=1 Tax=Camelina sativa TaxID=90675 RepID=A0ABM0TU11_CAMSA|nr:PREDICTED: NAC transcription factor 29-like [Camelina sativa]
MAIPPRNKCKARSSPERQTQPTEWQTQPPPPKQNRDNPSSSSSIVDNFSSPSTKPFNFPPGYQFVPTDEELILYYLKPFLQKNKNSWLLSAPIHYVNIYESNPQQLSEQFEKGNEKEWFFISERTKQGRSLKRQKRGANGGYWNATVAAKKVNAGKGIVGYKKVLEYYVGERPNGVKTCWLMHEYSSESSSVDNEKVDYALCKIYLTPKGAKKKKADQEEENEKLKKEEEAVEHLDLHQPDQSQPHDMVYQPEYCLLPAEHQKPQTQPFPYKFPELISFEQEPVISEDFEDFFADFIKPHSLNGDEDSSSYGLFEGFDTQGMIKACTN